MIKLILKDIEKLFNERLQSKTGWGKNEVIKIYNESVNEILMEYLEKMNAN